MAHFIPLDGYKLDVIESPSTFRPPFTISETGEIAAAVTGGTAYNGTAVRLESIVLDKETDTAVLGVSPTTFYDLLATNILYTAPREALDGIITEHIRDRAEAFRDSHVPADAEILEDKRFANALAVSLIVEDIDGRLLLTERAADLAIGAGLYGVSATRGVTVEDIDSAHPILAAITNGSNIPFNKDNFTVQGIYLGDSKKQPTLFCKTVLDYSLVGEIPAPDGKNTSYLLVNKSNRETLDELKVSEAARAHLNMTI